MNFKKYRRVLNNPTLILLKLCDKGAFNWMDDETYLKMKFRLKMGYDLNTRNPLSFNEKLQWLKLHDRKPYYTKLVDKYDVKYIVSRLIGEEYIIPTIGIYEHFADIDFKSFPDKFVLKCTHDSGGLVICEDKKKFDIDSAKKKIEKSLNTNYFWIGREWAYKDVKPRIIAEKYMENKTQWGGEIIENEFGNRKMLTDYKFMCFNGKVECSFVCTERNSSTGLRVTFFDKNWNPLPFERSYKKSDLHIPKPDLYNDMVLIAEKLSTGLPFVRVDLYIIDNHIYFGEMTLYPGGGFEAFSPLEWDYKIGQLLNIDEI